MVSQGMVIMILLGGICGVLALGISLICVACVVGFTRSTHKIQYVPLENPQDSLPVVIEREAEEERELMASVGKKKKKLEPTEADVAIETITESDVLY